MALSSFLSRVTKYSRKARFNPGENRLTEVTAGVLDPVHVFARELTEAMPIFGIEDLTARAEAAEPQTAEIQQRAIETLERRLRSLRAIARPHAAIRTQLGTRTGGFVDLE